MKCSRVLMFSGSLNVENKHTIKEPKDKFHLHAGTSGCWLMKQTNKQTKNLAGNRGSQLGWAGNSFSLEMGPSREGQGLETGSSFLSAPGNGGR